MICFKNSRPISGPTRQTKPVSFVLKDQGVDQVSVFGAAEGIARHVGIQLGHEIVGKRALLEHSRRVRCDRLSCRKSFTTG